MKRFGLLVALMTVAACGDTVDIAIENPRAFSMDWKDNKITGTYNPSGWTSDEVQGNIAVQCPNGKLASYAEEPQSNGLVAFQTTCA